MTVAEQLDAIGRGLREHLPSRKLTQIQRVHRLETEQPYLQLVHRSVQVGLIITDGPDGEQRLMAIAVPESLKPLPPFDVTGDPVAGVLAVLEAGRQVLRRERKRANDRRAKIRRKLRRDSGYPRQ